MNRTDFARRGAGTIGTRGPTWNRPARAGRRESPTNGRPPAGGKQFAMNDASGKGPHGRPGRARGKLKIGDDWNAITIIALSQSSPLKAIAELVENSIDAKARTITITRGRDHGQHFLGIRDDGEGVPRDVDGRPNFRYVATHICDSVKRR